MRPARISHLIAYGLIGFLATGVALPFFREPSPIYLLELGYDLSAPVLSEVGEHSDARANLPRSLKTRSELALFSLLEASASEPPIRQQALLLLGSFFVYREPCCDLARHYLELYLTNGGSYAGAMESLRILKESDGCGPETLREAGAALDLWPVKD